MPKTDWNKAIIPLLKKYKGKKHPLDYKNLYQLVVMVILSAQASDKHINNIALPFFKTFPDMKALASADEQSLHKYLGKVRNFRNKTRWLMKLASLIKEDKNIPITMEELSTLPGIGRKSANVIMREAGAKAEGVIVDLHVLRVAPRLGIASGTNREKIERQIMEAVAEKYWGEVGMAFSFLGREICRPKEPLHADCVMKKVCEFYKAKKESSQLKRRN